jgi:UDP-N-acetylmuramoylalanine--D-glutamate ligase
VLELSSYQIDLTQSLDCDVAVLLNITPDHLDRYENLEAYAASKARLFEMQSPGHNLVVNDQCVTDFGVLDHVQGNHIYGVSASFIDDVMDHKFAEIRDRTQFPTLQGPHNLQNMLAATEVCDILGLSVEQIREGLRTYRGLPHRMERVREKDGVVFVNDSKATNPTATAPALAAFERIRWICGGQAKTDNLDECSAHFGHVASAYTIGEAAELFERLLRPHIPVKNCGKLDAAVSQAAADAEAGDTVLLSPACASFDQFRHFEDRGDQFRRLVEDL